MRSIGNVRGAHSDCQYARPNTSATSTCAWYSSRNPGAVMRGLIDTSVSYRLESTLHRNVYAVHDVAESTPSLLRVNTFIYSKSRACISYYFYESSTITFDAFHSHAHGHDTVSRQQDRGGRTRAYRSRFKGTIQPVRHDCNIKLYAWHFTAQHPRDPLRTDKDFWERQ